MRREKKKSILSLTAEKLYIRREDWGRGGGDGFYTRLIFQGTAVYKTSLIFIVGKSLGGGLLQHFYLYIIYCLWNTLSKTSVLNKLGLFFFPDNIWVSLSLPKIEAGS